MKSRELIIPPPRWTEKRFQCKDIKGPAQDGKPVTPLWKGARPILSGRDLPPVKTDGKHN